MCIICVEYNKGKLTLPEAWRNYLEMVDTIDNEHSLEIQDMLWEDAIADDEFDNFLVLKEYPYRKALTFPFIPDEEELSDDYWYEDYDQED